jgi:beta-RFAP synthase
MRRAQDFAIRISPNRRVTDRNAKSQIPNATMLARFVRITAASRLHFGLISFGHESGRQFGGVGLMVEKPSLRLKIVASPVFGSIGPVADRVEAAGRQWTKWRRLSELPNCRIEVVEAPPSHTGLGSGTQLSLAVAAALNVWAGQTPASAAETAAGMGRGLRSAVGTHGFDRGGLIVELGKMPGETVSLMECRVELPGDWRWVLICPRGVRGLHGANEVDMFRQLAPVPESVSNEMLCEMRERMLPAARDGRVEDFGESVYRFGYQAGMCYAAVQPGAYCSDQAAQLVSVIRSCGIAGAGQSSWGPTIFALCRDSDQAAWLVRELNQRGFLEDSDVVISPTCNAGARITSGEDDSES